MFNQITIEVSATQRCALSHAARGIQYCSCLAVCSLACQRRRNTALTQDSLSTFGAQHYSGDTGGEGGTSADNPPGLASSWPHEFKVCQYKILWRRSLNIVFSCFSVGASKAFNLGIVHGENPRVV